jgi:uncharacterized protein (TIGR03086 family)
MGRAPPRVTATGSGSDSTATRGVARRSTPCKTNPANRWPASATKSHMRRRVVRAVEELVASEAVLRRGAVAFSVHQPLLAPSPSSSSAHRWLAGRRHMNGRTALERAAGEFRRRLIGVDVEDWTRPTPCDEWNVRQLVNHVIGGNFRYVMIMNHEGDDVILRTRDADWLTPDPVAAFDVALDRVTSAFAKPGALRAHVCHPKVGSVTGAELRVLRVNELTVHAWDLARAVGADDRLDEQVVIWLVERLEPLLSASGLDKTARSDDRASSDAQACLLRLLGRAPKAPLRG